MSSRGAVSLNRLINRQLGLCGCVETQPVLEVVPHGEEADPDTPQGKVCTYSVPVMGTVTEKLSKRDGEGDVKGRA